MYDIYIIIYLFITKRLLLKCLLLLKCSLISTPKSKPDMPSLIVMDNGQDLELVNPPSDQTTEQFKTTNLVHTLGTTRPMAEPVSHTVTVDVPAAPEQVKPLVDYTSNSGEDYTTPDRDLYKNISSI